VRAVALGEEFSSRLWAVNVERVRAVALGEEFSHV